MVHSLCISMCMGEEFQDFYILFHSNNLVLSLFLHYRFQPHILYHKNLWSLNSEAVQHKPLQVQNDAVVSYKYVMVFNCVYF